MDWIEAPSQVLMERAGTFVRPGVKIIVSALVNFKSNFRFNRACCRLLKSDLKFEKAISAVGQQECMTIISIQMVLTEYKLVKNVVNVNFNEQGSQNQSLWYTIHNKEWGRCDIMMLNNLWTIYQIAVEPLCRFESNASTQRGVHEEWVVWSIKSICCSSVASLISSKTVSVVVAVLRLDWLKQDCMSFKILHESRWDFSWVAISYSKILERTARLEMGL